MLSRLSILKSHLTATGDAPPENLLQKYKDMAKLDIDLLEGLYFYNNKKTVKFFENVLTSEKVFT